MMLPTLLPMFAPSSGESVSNDPDDVMKPILLERKDLPLQLSDAVTLVVLLATSLHDWHRCSFEVALSDLLKLIRKTPVAIGHVRSMLTREFSLPYNNQWRVSATEYERRRVQVFLAIRQLQDAIANNDSSFLVQ